MRPLLLCATPCNMKYLLLAMNEETVYSLIAVQSVRSPYRPSSTKALSLPFKCQLTGTSGSLPVTITNHKRH